MLGGFQEGDAGLSDEKEVSGRRGEVDGDGVPPSLSWYSPDTDPPKPKPLGPNNLTWQGYLPANGMLSWRRLTSRSNDLPCNRAVINASAHT